MIVTLIQVAFMIPVKYFVERLFELSNEPDTIDSWCFWFGPRMWLTGRTSWWYSEPGNHTAYWRQLLAPGAVLCVVCRRCSRRLLQGSGMPACLFRCWGCLFFSCSQENEADIRSHSPVVAPAGSSLARAQ